MSLSPAHLDRLAAAKLWLVSQGTSTKPNEPRDLPYLAHALYALAPVLSSEIETITCDEYWRIYVNPTWLESAALRDIAAELAHLTWHLLHEHAARARDLDVSAATAPGWQQATDAAIEHLLRAEMLAPDGLTRAERLGLPSGLSAEEYFAMLTGLPVSVDDCLPVEAGCGSGCDGLTRTTELPPGLDLAEIGPHDAQQIRRLVAVAYREHITERGTKPGDAWRWTQDILEPTIAWQPLLASAVRRAIAWTTGNTDYTFTRRSRRQATLPNVVLPGTRRPVPNISIVIDTSGSIDDALLGLALGEVDGALRGLGVSDASVTVLACDAAVQTVTRVRKAQDARLAGGGGTDMRAGIATAAGHRPRPDLIVVFTDGYTPWPETPPPGCSVIAGMLARPGHSIPPSPPWARRIECRI